LIVAEAEMRLSAAANGLHVLVRHVAHQGAQQMHDALLRQRPREQGGHRFGQALQAHLRRTVARVGALALARLLVPCVAQVRVQPRVQAAVDHPLQHLLI